MKKVTFLCVVALCSQFAEARQINVADHGIVPGKDVTYPLNRLIQAVQGENDVTLVFPKGQYEFYPDCALEAFRAVSNHDNSLKRMAFPLLACKNLTIDGGGSLFMFHGRISPIVLDHASGVVLKNFSIDWKRSFHDELTVVERNEQDKSFVVEADPSQYPYRLEYGAIWFQRYNWEDPFGSNIVFDPETKAPIHDTSRYFVEYKEPLEAIAAGKNRIRIEAAVEVPPPVGSVLVAYGVTLTNRLVPAIHLANSRDVQVQNVTVHDAGGMGLIAERTENVHLDHFVVTSREGRLVSTRADATHFIGCKGTVRLENCRFEHMLDDGINVHGAYVKVDEYLGDNEFLCAISHPQQWGLTFAEPGDKVALLSREILLPFFNTTVEKVRVLNEERLVVTLAEVPVQMPEAPLSMENLSWYPNVVMKKNTIRQNRARSALITTKGKVLIEDNYFSSQMHGILIEGDNNYWYESGGVQDVTIKGNVFANIGYAGGPAYPLYVCPLLTPEQRMGEGHYHRNINFVDNTVIGFNGHLAFARSVSGLKIARNTLEFRSDYPAISDFPAIDLGYCEGVSVKDNRTRGFGPPLAISRLSDSTNVQVEANDGFEMQ